MVSGELGQEEGHGHESDSGDSGIFRVQQELQVALVLCNAIASARLDVAGLMCANPRQESRCGGGALFLRVQGDASPKRASVCSQEVEHAISCTNACMDHALSRSGGRRFQRFHPTAGESRLQRVYSGTSTEP